MNNKQMLPVTLALGILIVLGGCVRSIHPVYTQGSLVFERALIGKWTSQDAETTWEFSRRGNNAYRLLFTDDEDRTAKFTIRLTTLGDSTLIDFYPSHDRANKPGFYDLHSLRTHTFGLFTLKEDNLEIRFLDPSRMREFLADDSQALPHESVDSSLVLTASTDQLRQFLENHLDDESFFAKPIALERNEGE